ncbi:hypothetical protein [Roseobacter sp. HKCCA0434]|uniref:hypothetical protein n=1 Tax=Roseobacter sp. HKCCA0434 TaxID=3079297 RepID=UPI002905B854|nr:hypothetical protein [Roseobacter sp. HKCCA0434]
MKKTLLAAAAFLLSAGAAHACPNWQLDSPADISGTASYFYSPRTYNVLAGGDRNLNACGIRNRTDGVPTGFVAATPDFELYFQKDRNYALEFRTIGNCDTVLLINTGGGNWYYDDDDNGGGGAKIRLTNPSAGVYDIWIGTYGSQLCDAQLQIETF